MVFSDAQPIQFWLSDCETYNEEEPFGIFRRCFCQPFECEDTITIQFTDTVNIAYSFQVLDENDNELLSDDFDQSTYDDGFIYSYSFVPIDYDICTKRVKIIILSPEASPEQVASSDCIDIQSSHPGTVGVTYSNNRNYVGLVYTDVSPDAEFFLRIPAMFYHERQQGEEEVLQLTNQIVKQNSVVKTQKELRTDSLPDYMHKKIQFVLKHNSVLIKNKYWIQESEYELQDSNRRNPLQKAITWLTDRNSIQRNVL